MVMLFVSKAMQKYDIVFTFPRKIVKIFYNGRFGGKKRGLGSGMGVEDMERAATEEACEGESFGNCSGGDAESGKR